MAAAGKRWIRLRYEAMAERHAEVLRYLFRTSEEFSFHTRRLKPFSETDQRLAHDAALAPLSEEMTLRKSGMENWPGKYGRDPHEAYVCYRASAQARDVVLSWPNPFEAVERGLPEDICFYRRGEVWFATVTHERLAEARLDTAGDAALFQPLDSAGWDYDERRRIWTKRA